MKSIWLLFLLGSFCQIYSNPNASFEETLVKRVEDLYQATHSKKRDLFPQFIELMQLQGLSLEQKLKTLAYATLSVDEFELKKTFVKGAYHESTETEDMIDVLNKEFKKLSKVYKSKSDQRRIKELQKAAKTRLKIAAYVNNQKYLNQSEQNHAKQKSAEKKISLWGRLFGKSSQQETRFSEV